MRVSRTLVLVHAPLVSRDLEGELRRLGWNVVSVHPPDLDLATIRRLSQDLAPAAFLGINHSPELAWAVTRNGVRYLSWTVDPLTLDRMRVLEGTEVGLVSVFLHRSSQVRTFQAMGFPQVDWLPLAAPAHRFEVSGQRPLEGLPPSFVGSSLLDEIDLYREATAKWGWSRELTQAVESTLEPLVDLALGEVGFPGFHPGGLDLPRNLLAIASVAPEEIAQALNAWLSARVRRRRLAEPGMEAVVVHGDGGWIEVVGQRWKGPLADGSAMTSVYAGSLANLDIPRIHQRDIATLRAFDVAASGGCLLAEPSSDLCRVFEEGREFLAYRNGEELQERLRALRCDTSLGHGIGLRAKERARAEHRLELRARRLLEPLG